MRAAARPEPEPVAEPLQAELARSLEISHDAPRNADTWFAPPAALPTQSAPQQTAQHAAQQTAQQTAQHPPTPAEHAPTPAPPARPPSVVDLDSERPLPSIERALSAPGGRRDLSWRRRVKVVAGGQGPGKRDQESLDRDRARLPLPGPRRIVVLGCHGGAGQTMTSVMIARVLATLRGHRVAALDLSAQAKLGAMTSGGQLDIIAAGPVPDYDQFARKYPITLVDPVPSGLTRVLGLADQLVIVVPPTSEGASSLANTQQWLDAHGHDVLAARAVTVVNGVRKEVMADVLRAESVARGRCRAIVRVPWDDQLSARHPQIPQAPQTRLAYTALAGVIVAGLAAPAPAAPTQPAPKEPR